MKTVGLLGGMSWVSTQTYYQIINQDIHKKYGEQHSAKIIMYSVDYEEVKTILQNQGWDRLGQEMIKCAQTLEKAGAELLVLCNNTTHKIMPMIEGAIKIPVLHIVDAVAHAVSFSKKNRVALLGTKFTMEDSFYKDRLKEKFGIDVLIPEEKDRNDIHQIIHEELAVGKLNDISRQRMIKIIDDLMKQGAQGIVFACTEIGLLVQQKDTNAPLFDSAVIHAHRAAELL